MKFCYSLHLSSPDSEEELWQEILHAGYQPRDSRPHAASKDEVHIHFFEAEAFIKE